MSWLADFEYVAEQISVKCGNLEIRGEVALENTKEVRPCLDLEEKHRLPEAPARLAKNTTSKLPIDGIDV